MKLLGRVLLLLLVFSPLAAVEVAKITPVHAARLVAEGKAVLVDVREPAEWADRGVAAPAVLLPKSDFDGARKAWTPFLAQNDGKEIILYCRSGHRAGIVAATLAENGVPVANAGGLKDWLAAGLPTRPVPAAKP